MAEISTRYGVLQTFSPTEDLISRFLSRYGEWAQHEIRFVAGCLPDNARVLDIGAFLGTFSLGVAQLKPLASVCFVDANPTVVPLLRKNVETNLKAASVVLEAVVGSTGIDLQASEIPGNHGSFSINAQAESERTSAVLASRVISLSELDADFGPFDLVKIDAEGMELRILSADLPYLAATRSDFWIECNATQQSLDLAELLLAQGFDLYYFAFPAINQFNFNNEGDREYPFAYEAGLWATRGAPPRISSELAQAGCILEKISNRESLRRALWLTPRWSPKDWGGSVLSEVVARAGHLLLGEEYEQFLVHSGGDVGSDVGFEPLALRVQRRLESAGRLIAERAKREQEQEQLHARELERQTTANAALSEELSLAMHNIAVIQAGREAERKGFEREVSLLREQFEHAVDRALKAESALRAERERARSELNALRAKLDAEMYSEDLRENVLRREREDAVGALAIGEAALADAKAQLRAYEIMLAKERERFASSIKAIEQELLNARMETANIRKDMERNAAENARNIAHINAIYASNSWRWMMPGRVLGRVVRGDWSELARLLKAKIGIRKH